MPDLTTREPGWPDNDAARDQNIATIVDRIYLFHPYANDKDIDAVLTIELEGLEPDTLGAIVASLGTLEAHVEALELKLKKKKKKKS